MFKKKLNKRDDEELTVNDANIILEYCEKYFNFRPLTSWFDTFDYFIKLFGNSSYYDDSCINLDLVQWATSPKWKGIPPKIKTKHLNNDLPIIKHLLEKNFETIFFNGKTVVENLTEYLNINLAKKTTVFKYKNGTEKRLEIFSGNYNKVKIIGWNLYLQNAITGNENLELLNNIIKSNI